MVTCLNELYFWRIVEKVSNQEEFELFLLLRLYYVMQISYMLEDEGGLVITVVV